MDILHATFSNLTIQDALLIGIVLAAVFVGVLLYRNRLDQAPDQERPFRSNSPQLLGREGLVAAEVNSRGGTIIIEDTVWPAISEARIPRGARARVAGLTAENHLVLIEIPSAQSN